MDFLSGIQGVLRALGGSFFGFYRCFKSVPSGICESRVEVVGVDF